VESISRLAEAVWLIGQLSMESKEGRQVGPTSQPFLPLES
jgi:hypothetical protein